MSLGSPRGTGFPRSTPGAYMLFYGVENTQVLDSWILLLLKIFGIGNQQWDLEHVPVKMVSY